MFAAATREATTLANIKIAPEKNIYWLETIFYSFKYDFQKLNPQYFQSNVFRIPTLEEEFFFKAGHSSPNFSIQLHRVLYNPDKRLDDGCHLNIWFTLLDSGKDPELRTMKYGDGQVDVSYGLDIMKAKDCKCWTLKCVIKLFEMTSLRNELWKTQNELIKDLAIKSDRSGTGRKACEMAFLLRQKSLDDVFSGRQKEDFSSLKTGLIKGTLGVVNEIARKFNLKLKKIPYKPGLDLSVYLDYIQKQEVHGIRRKDVPRLYLDSHRYGLDFLRIECSEFMLRNLDSEFIVDVLLVSDLVQDETLMNKAVDVFWANKEQVLDSNSWMDLLNSNVEVAQSIVDATVRKVGRRSTTQIQTRH